jgi:hypothetical protein
MVSGDEEVKLLLEAFQMSVSACLSHPQTPLLRAQMIGRLMAVKLSPSVKVMPACANPALSYLTASLFLHSKTL